MNDVGLKIIGSIEIAKLHLGETDVLVVHADRPVSAQTADAIRKAISPRLPFRNDVLVLDPGITLSVVEAGTVVGIDGGVQ